MSYKNKSDQAAAAKRHYEKNKDLVKARARTFTNARTKELTAFIVDYKNKPCMDCNQKFPHYVMDFDHVSGEKRDNVSCMKKDGVSRDTLLKEINKCEVVCSNCHRIRTWNRLQDNKSTAE